MCVFGYIFGDSVMFDFVLFEFVGMLFCSCIIYIVVGSCLEFNYVYFLGYYGCGFVILISYQMMFIIWCLQGVELLFVMFGDFVMV